MDSNFSNYTNQLTAALDKVVMQKSVTSFMADNAMRARFVGAKTVVLPQVEFQGLSDYNRDTGFSKGAVKVTGETLELKKDRARSFNIDREDMDETGVAGLAGQIMGEFVRTKVAPEIDAYVLSKMYGVATAASTPQKVTLGSGETLNTHCYKLLNSAIQKVNEAVGYDEELVAFLNPAVYDALMGTEELSRRIVVSDFKKGEVNTRVQRLNNTVLIPVPDARMKSAYTFVTAADGGFQPASGAKNVGFIVMPRKAGILVKKTEKIRTFTPDKNQEMDAYKFDYRLYYDAFVKTSMKKAIYVYENA